MKLHFHGAARQVTGSMYVLELADDYQVLIDCGTDMDRNHQAQDPNQEIPSQFFPFEPSLINVVVLTHAHIDHSGNLPMLYREGYEGQILCTPPTADLTELLLYDAASLHARRLKAAQGESKKKQKKMDYLLRRGDLYLERDVQTTNQHLVSINFNRRFCIKPGLWMTFIPAGHLLGAAHVLFEIEEEGELKKILFSGDIGRKNYPLHIDPQTVPAVDVLICESTYGNRRHEDKEEPVDALEKVIRRTCIEQPGRLIIPAFSVGRTQAVLYCLKKLIEEKQFPAIRVFTDSPLARNSTRVYNKYISYLNPEAREFQEEHEALFDFENLVYVGTEKESQAINNYREPCIILSASGMISGGRVEYHVAQNISNAYAGILLIGYSAEGSLGRELLAGKESIRIKDKEYKVNAEITKIDVFSGHADLDGLLEFVQQQAPQKLQKIFLVHGEEHSMENFKSALEAKGYQDVILPEKHACFSL